VLADLTSGEVDIPLDKVKAEVLVLTTAVEVLLFPDALVAMAKVMKSIGANWTVSSNAFEAANVGLISGDIAAETEATRRIIDHAVSVGASIVLVPESGHAYQTLRWDAAERNGATLPFEVLAVSEYLAREVDAGRLKLKSAANGKSITYHDPCRLARQSGVMEEPRRLLQAMGMKTQETDSNRRENRQCKWIELLIHWNNELQKRREFLIIRTGKQNWPHHLPQTESFYLSTDTSSM
jgi:Fe-S oxidoreductase